MRTTLQRFACVAAIATAAAGVEINWRSVSFEAGDRIALTAGSTRPYTVIGRSEEGKTDVTKSEYLYLTSSDSTVLEIDRQRGLLVAKKPGHAHVQLAFRHLGDMFPAFVREPASAPRGLDGVWRAEYTSPMGERPKMVSDIFFDLNTDGAAVTGTVHAAHWPGDGPITDGKIEGGRVRFTMVGALPFTANGVVGYPKLCFDGTRNGSEMKLEMRWAEAQRPCDDGKLHPMAAKKLLD
jgi:hypothetical protein